MLSSRHTWSHPLGIWQGASPPCSWQTVPWPAVWSCPVLLKVKTLPTPSSSSLSICLFPSPFLFLFPPGFSAFSFSLPSSFLSPSETPYISSVCMARLFLTSCGLDPPAKVRLVPFHNSRGYTGKPCLNQQQNPTNKNNLLR